MGSGSKKNLIVKIACITLFSAAFSCTDLENQQKVTLNDKSDLLDGNAFLAKGIVHFPSVSFYQQFVETRSEAQEESLLKDLDGSADYISLKKVSGLKSKNSKQGRTLGAKEIELAETNDFISTLINSNGMISIGDYYFKINLNTEKAYVLRKEHLAQIEDLANENIENKNIMIFSTSDDVLNLLEEGMKGTSSGRSQRPCRFDNAAGKEDKDFEYFVDCGYPIIMDNKVVYQKVAIYFSLQAKTKVFRDNAFEPLNGTAQAISYYVLFKPKCLGETEESGVQTDGGSYNELSRRPYERSYGQSKYIYQATFSTGYYQCADFLSRKYEIIDGY